MTDIMFGKSGINYLAEIKDGIPDKLLPSDRVLAVTGGRGYGSGTVSDIPRGMDELIKTDEDAGYTEESLRMLESEEGQSNAIFALFGSAAQRAQNFENGIAKFLVVYNQVTSEGLTAEDLESRNADLNRKTMGQLLHKLKTIVTFPDDTYSQYFQEALSQRNFLMHQYFLERNHVFATEESRLEALAELSKIENVFERARIAANAMRIALCRKLGIDPGDNA